MYVEHLLCKGITLAGKGQLFALVYGFGHVDLTTRASVTHLCNGRLFPPLPPKLSSPAVAFISIASYHQDNELGEKLPYKPGLRSRLPLGLWALWGGNGIKGYLVGFLVK